MSKFKQFLANIFFPKPSKQIIVYFGGVSGVGKSYLRKQISHGLLTKWRFFGFSSGYKFQKFCNFELTDEISTFQKFFDITKQSGLPKQVLELESIARLTKRNFFIDECLFNDFPFNQVQEFQKQYPDLFKSFFLNTVYIYIYDTPENILKKVNYRKTINSNIRTFYENSDDNNLNFIKKALSNKMIDTNWIESSGIPVLRLDNSLPLQTRISIIKDFIKKHS